MYTSHPAAQGEGTQARLHFHQRQATVVAYGVDGDAVVPAVGGVDESTVGSDLGVGCVAVPLEIPRQGRNYLQLDQGPGIGVVAVDVDRVPHLVVGVDEAAGVEGQVAGAAATDGAHVGLCKGGQRRGCGIQGITENLVSPQVAGEHVAAVGTDHRAMGMGSLLPAGVDTPTLVLHE